MGRLFRGLLTIIALAAIGSVVWLWSLGVEFGARPPETIKPIAAAADVKFVDANGIHFAYIEEGTGPLVLLFHGYPETARSWAGVQRSLANAGYRVVAPYMRGYPPTSAPADGDYAVPRLGEDVIALIGALGEQKAIVVGHDWGASAVYNAATAHPEKITKLVAVALPHARAFAGDSTVFVEAPHFVYYQFPWAERLVWSNDFAHLDRLYKTWSPTYTPTTEVMEDVKATMRAPGGVEGPLGYYWALFKGGIDPKAAQLTITVPTLVIAGRADGAAHYERFEKAAPAFTAGYTFVTLNNVGHFPPIEAPDATATAILSFLGPAAAMPPPAP
jgi:pimeloyl-ACP methyl ester carboxylesterase